MTDLTDATWRKSNRSTAQGNCVEVAEDLAGVVGVRDSKNVAGPALVFDAARWRSFVCAVKDGALN